MTKENERFKGIKEFRLAEFFNKFAGKIVNPSDPNDPVLEEMRFMASRSYSELALVPSGTKREENFCRINAELVDAGNGQWRIGNRFFRG